MAPEGGPFRRKAAVEQCGHQLFAARAGHAGQILHDACAVQMLGDAAALDGPARRLISGGGRFGERGALRLCGRVGQGSAFAPQLGGSVHRLGRIQIVGQGHVAVLARNGGGRHAIAVRAGAVGACFHKVACDRRKALRGRKPQGGGARFVGVVQVRTGRHQQRHHVGKAMGGGGHHGRCERCEIGHGAGQQQGAHGGRVAPRAGMRQRRGLVLVQVDLVHVGALRHQGRDGLPITGINGFEQAVRKRGRGCGHRRCAGAGGSREAYRITRSPCPIDPFLMPRRASSSLCLHK